ncbi:MAG: hypothetical protein IAE99_11780 [Rhodothermales bacterium]|nr:hypothetical protein [Rhodothermales bacterium]
MRNCREWNDDEEAWRFRPTTLRRLDALTFGSDWAGGMKWVDKARDGHDYGATVDQMKAFASRSDNETLFKHGLDFLDAIETIYCASEGEKQAALAVFAKHKITHIRGIPVAQYLVLR